MVRWCGGGGVVGRWQGANVLGVGHLVVGEHEELERVEEVEALDLTEEIVLQVDVRCAVAQLQPVHRADAQPVEPQVRQPDHTLGRLLCAELLPLGLVEAPLGDEPHSEQPRLRGWQLCRCLRVLLEQRGVIGVERRRRWVLH